MKTNMYKSIQLKTKTLSVRNSIDRSPLRYGLFFTALVLACFTLSPQARGVCQDGCDTSGNENTFLGDDALVNNTGVANTAAGFNALTSNTTGIWNTATGSWALATNNGNFNTASGVTALFSNTFGGSNTATGKGALFSNTTGGSNTATGVDALRLSTTGNFCTATGASAL